MNSDINKNCQHILNDVSGELSVSTFDEFAEFEPVTNSGSALPGAVVDSILSDLDLIKVELAVSSDTPDDVKRQVLTAEELLELEVSLAALDAGPLDFSSPSKSVMNPELKKLITEDVEKRKNDARRNGRKATAHKKEMRDAYKAAKGGTVRPYQHHNNDQARETARQVQNKAAQKARRAKMTPDQKAAENAAGAQRRRDRKVKAKEEAENALAARAIA